MDRLKKLNTLLAEESFAIEDNRVFTILNEENIKKPIAVRKALAIKKIFEEAPVKILDSELIVGLRPRVSLPQYATEEEKEFIWNVSRLTPWMGYGHTSPSYPMVFKKGFRGIYQDAKSRFEDEIKKLQPDMSKAGIWEAAMIACNAVTSYASRYADEARRLADKEENPLRKDELLKIEKICRKIPSDPAESFYEALQSMWFTYSTLRMVGHYLIQIGRIDQYLYPYYMHDIKEGIITKEQAHDLLVSLWVKFNMTDFLLKSDKDLKAEEISCVNTGVCPHRIYMGAGAVPGVYETGNNLILSGLTPEGIDGTNELTYLCLDVAIELKRRDPITSIRLNDHTPEELTMKSIELMKLGIGMPAFYNDNVVIPALQKAGIRLEDARNYCNDGCIEVYVPGKSEDRNIAIWIEALKCLELALNDGMSYMSGITTQLLQTVRDNCGSFMDDGDVQGPSTGDASKFATFDALMDAFKKQLSFSLEKHARLSNTTDLYFSKISPCPLLTATVENCVEKGKDFADGGPVYNNTGTTLRGLPNTAESLAAIKKLVFEEKKIAMSDLLEALKSNFKLHPEIRKMLLEAPKWGNNDDYVDSILREITEFWYDEVAKYTNPRGGKFKAGLWATYADQAGQTTGASADGRFAGEAIATNLSPIGSRRGLTSLLNSGAKIDYTRCSNSAIMDIHIMPSTLDSKEKMQKLASLIKVHFKMGGFGLVFNVVERETLVKAQQKPENYKDLLVRIHGYSARFVTLSKEYQDLVIARSDSNY